MRTQWSSRLNVKRREPWLADAAEPFGSAIRTQARHPFETNAFPNSPAWLTSWRILVEQDSPFESSCLRVSWGASRATSKHRPRRVHAQAGRPALRRPVHHHAQQRAEMTRASGRPWGSSMLGGPQLKVSRHHATRVRRPVGAVCCGFAYGSLQPPSRLAAHLRITNRSI